MQEAARPAAAKKQRHRGREEWASSNIPFFFFPCFFLSLFYLPFFISRSTDKWIMNLRIYIYIYYQIDIFEYIINLYVIEH